MTPLDLQNILCVVLVGQALWPMVKRYRSKPRSLDAVIGRYLSAYYALQLRDNLQPEAFGVCPRPQGSAL